MINSKTCVDAAVDQSPDKGLLEQCFINVINNLCKFTGYKGIINLLRA